MMFELDPSTVLHLEVAAMFGELTSLRESDALARDLWEARQLERVREGARRRARRRYYRDKADSERWAAKIARLEARRRRLVEEADPAHRERCRRAALRAHYRMMADPERHARHVEYRRELWRRNHPLPACVDCGGPVHDGRAKRCQECAPARRRQLAAARQRRRRAKAWVIA